MIRSVHALLACLALTFVACQEDSSPTAERENDASMPDMTVDAAEPDATIDAEAPDMAAPDMAEGPCEANEDCDSGLCEDGVCVPTECAADGDCPQPMLQTCRDFECRDRCFQDRCLRGGICIDGACMPEECTVDGDCEGTDLCREGRCVEASPCETNEECAPDGRCLEGNCEPLTVCAGDGNCAADEICEDGLCRVREVCEERDECGEGQDCVAGRCVPFVCRGPADCEGGEVCRGGECVEPMIAEVSEVFILTRPRAMAIGERLRFRAVGVDLRGDVVAVDGFEWATEGPGVIDAAGELTAGPDLGAVSITASYASGDAPIVSAPVTIQVIDLAPAEGGRVRLTDAGTGLPIQGATVRIGDADLISDEDGQVLFEPDGPTTLSVFADGYEYLTLVDAAPTDLRITLAPRVVDNRVAGFTGTLDFDRVMQEGEVDLGLAGAAFAGGLTHIGIAALLGDIFNTPLNAGPVNFDLPLPGGLTLAAQVPILGRIDAKSDYFVTGGAGFQFGWAFAGRIDFNTLLALFGGGGGGGGGFNVGEVLAQLLPFFDRFNHGLRVDELVALPTRADEDDIDGDGDREEFVPDYDRFTTLDIEPGQAQRLRVGVDVPAPELPGEGSPVALVFAGTEVDGVGFIPLGISATDEGGLVAMRQAAPYGGLEVGEPVILSLAARFGGGNFLPGEISARMVRFEANLPGEVALPAFMAPPESPTWEPALRRVEAGVVDGADVHRVVFDGPLGRWNVYFAGVPEFTMPFPPDGSPDLSAGGTVRVEGLDLTVDFDALVGPGAGELPDIDQRTGGFSRAIAE